MNNSTCDVCDKETWNQTTGKIEYDRDKIVKICKRCLSGGSEMNPEVNEYTYSLLIAIEVCKKKNWKRLYDGFQEALKDVAKGKSINPRTKLAAKAIAELA